MRNFEIEWNKIKTAPKSKKIILLGTTDAGGDFYSEIEGKWNKELECFCTKSGWVVAAVAWRKK